MVKIGFQNGSYAILGIAGEYEDHNIYIVRDRAKKQYIACELKSISQINRWLPEINKAAESGRIVCFTENAYLYIITSYTDGENALLSFSVQHTGLHRKLELLQKMTFQLVDCADMPELVLKGLLTEQSAVLFRGAIALNCYIDPNEKRSAFEMYSDLFASCFTPADIKRLKYLSIVLQKLSNGIYKNFMEIYLDIGQLLEKIEQNVTILDRVKEFRERTKGVFRIVISAAVLVAAAVVIYNMVNSSSQQSALDAYTPIDHIGTVSLNSDRETIRDIHVKNE